MESGRPEAKHRASDSPMHTMPVLAALSDAWPETRPTKLHVNMQFCFVRYSTHNGQLLCLQSRNQFAPCAKLYPEES